MTARNCLLTTGAFVLAASLSATQSPSLEAHAASADQTGITWLDFSAGVAPSLESDQELVLGFSNAAGGTAPVVWFIRASTPLSSPFDGTPLAGKFDLTPASGTWMPSGSFSGSSSPAQVSVDLINAVLADVEATGGASLDQWTQPPDPVSFGTQGDITTWKAWHDNWLPQSASYFIWTPTYLSSLGAPSYAQVLSVAQIVETALELQATGGTPIDISALLGDPSYRAALNNQIDLTFQAVSVEPLSGSGSLYGIELSAPIRISVALGSGGEGGTPLMGRLGVLAQVGNLVYLTVGNGFDLQSMTFSTPSGPETVPVHRLTPYGRIATVFLPDETDLSDIPQLLPTSPNTVLQGTSLGWNPLSFATGVPF